MLYFLSGGGNVNGSNFDANAGNNGNVQGQPLDIHGQTVPGVAALVANLRHSTGHGVFELSPQQSKLTVENVIVAKFCVTF